MTSNTVPIYRHGRKFYVSAEEYEHIRSEERRHRRIASQKSQHLPVSKTYQTPIRSPSESLYNPIQRSSSNTHDFKYGVLKIPRIPIHSLINTKNQRESNRVFRSTLRPFNDRNDLSSLTSAISRKKIPTFSRSDSSDKLLHIQRTPLSSLSSNTDNEINRSSSAEIAQRSSSSSSLSSRQQKPRQQSQSPLRRSVPPATVSDYGISPITSFSLTPTDQTHTQRNTSRLTNYFARMKQSSLNPPSKPSSSAISGTGSLFETGIQGSDHVYTVLGSSNRRTGTGISSLLTRSTSDNSKNENFQRDTTSGSWSDDNSSSLSMLYQQRNDDPNSYRRAEFIVETDDDHSQQRDSLTRSTNRSQSSDGLTEKKRVRFADMEGFTLETAPSNNQSQSSINNRLLTRRQHIQFSSDSRGQLRPFTNALYQGTTRVGRSKLATDV